MTNKKFKLAAMSLALTACVAASPLAANADTADAAAEGTAPVVGTPAPAAEAPAPAAEDPAPAAETPAPAAETPAPAAEAPAPAAETPAPAAENPAPAAETPAPAAENPAPAAAPVLMVMAPAPAAPAASTSAAQIGETSYDTLEDAIAAANASTKTEEVVLQKDHTGVVELVRSIILNLNGNKIINPDGSGKAAITVKPDETTGETLDVTIKNGTVTGGEDSGIRVEGSDAVSPTVKLEDLTITDNTGTFGGGVHIEDGDVTIDGCTITENESKKAGGGVFVGTTSRFGSAAAAEDASLTVSDSAISDNTAGGGGGGIYFKSKEGSLTVSDESEICSNDAGDVGGGIYSFTEGVGDVSITDSTISDNTSKASGGGLYLFSRLLGLDSDREQGSTTISGNTIDGNTATRDGGGIQDEAVDAVIADNNITNNTAGKYGNGGGVNLANVSATLEDNLIDHNYAGNTGGGIRADASNSGPSTTCTLRGNTISNNSASTGGGISSGSSSMIYSNKLTGHTCTILMESGEITRNTSRFALSGYNYGGGGVYLVGNGSRFIMQGGSISENEAACCGGGINSQNYRGVTITGGTIQNNKAAVDGGAVYIRNAAPSRTFNLDDGKTLTNTVAEELLDIGKSVVISGNHAGRRGGGIYAENGVTVKVLGFVLNNRAEDAGDDLYLTAGTEDSKNQNVLILRKVDDGWTLVQCDHPIDGWYFDKENKRWNADETDPEAPRYVTNFNTLLESGNLVLNDDGTYTLTVTDEPLALKAAHDVLPEPEPEPEPEPDIPTPDIPTPDIPTPDTPTPDTPDPVLPEEPVNPPVQDATPDDGPADAPVLPADVENPPVQDAKPGAALPKTGTANPFAALAMALGGMALTLGGAWTSLLGKNSKH